METITLIFPYFTIYVKGYRTKGEKSVYYPIDNSYEGTGDYLEEVTAELEGDLFLFLESKITIQQIIDLANEQL
jgi:hypothetical protein